MAMRALTQKNELKNGFLIKKNKTHQDIKYISRIKA